jgi:hypothetical protein
MAVHGVREGRDRASILTVVVHRTRRFSWVAAAVALRSTSR